MQYLRKNNNNKRCAGDPNNWSSHSSNNVELENAYCKQWMCKEWRIKKVKNGLENLW